MHNTELKTLKPCPHCGSDKTYICVAGDEVVTFAYVKCNTCHCRTGDMDTVAEAIAAWNARHNNKDKECCCWCNKYDEVLCDDWGNCFKWCPICGANLGHGY